MRSFRVCPGKVTLFLFVQQLIKHLLPNGTAYSSASTQPCSVDRCKSRYELRCAIHIVFSAWGLISCHLPTLHLTSTTLSGRQLSATSSTSARENSTFGAQTTNILYHSQLTAMCFGRTASTDPAPNSSALLLALSKWCIQVPIHKRMDDLTGRWFKDQRLSTTCLATLNSTLPCRFLQLCPGQQWAVEIKWSTYMLKSILSRFIVLKM